MPQTATAQNLHPKMVPFQIFQDASNSKSSKPTSQDVTFAKLPRCLKQQKLKTYIPKCCLSKASNSGKVQKRTKQQKLLNLYPKMIRFQIFQDASNNKSSKPTSQNNTFPNLPRYLKQQKLKIYIPKCCLSKSINMPKKKKKIKFICQKCYFSELPTFANCKKNNSLNLHPKILPFQIFQDTKTAKAQNLHPKILPFQIFQDASNSKSSKPTSQNGAFPNLPRLPFQIFQDASNSQKLKTYIPNCGLSKSSKMPQTSKAQNLHPKMVPFQIFQDVSNSTSAKPLSQNDAFPNLPRCLKQHKRKTYIPKYCLSKSSKMLQAAKAHNLHPKMMPFQIFQDASNSNSSTPTSQNAAFPNLPRCLK